MEGEEVFFCFVFIDLERQSLLPTYPQVGSKLCSSPQKFRLVSWIDFKNLKNVFERTRGRKA